VGIGSIRSVESMALAILRLIGEELRKDRTARVVAQVPVDVATYLINEKREWLRTLEDKSDAELVIVPNPNIQTPEYSLKRVRDDETELPENKQLSYLMPTAPEVAEPGSAQDKKPRPEVAAVAAMLPATPAPVVQQPAPPSEREPAVGVITRLKRWLFGDEAPAQAAPAAAPAARRHEGERGRRRDRDRDGRRARSQDEHARPRRQAEGRREQSSEREAAREHEGGRSREASRERQRDREAARGHDRPRERARETEPAPPRTAEA